MRKVHILQSKEIPFERKTYPMKTRCVFFVKRLHESWTAIEGCLLRAHVYRDQRTSSVFSLDMPWECKPQFAIEGHVNGFNHLRKGDMSTLNPRVKVNKIDPKIPLETSKKAPLALNN